MALPRQVQQQIKEANRIAEEIDKELESSNKKKDGEGNVVEIEVPEKKQEEGKKKESAAEPSTADDGAGDGAGEPEGKQQEAKPEESVDTWQHKYEVLQGKYNAEVPRLSRQLREQASELERVRNVLASLEKRKEEKPEGEIGKQQVQQFIKPDEIEEYGADFIDLVGRRAQEVARPEIDKLNKHIENLEKELQRIRQDVGSTSQNQFLTQLDQRVKDWRDINTDPRFLDWLDVEEEFTGSPRGELLRKAYEVGDVDRVSRFFTRFQNENAVTTATSNQPAENRQTATVGMDQLVAPGKPRSEQPADAPQGKRIWTEQEIANFYTDVQKGKYKNRKDEKDRIERQIHKAVSEGRIR